MILLSAFDDFDVFLANLTIDMKNLTSNLRQLEKELIQIHERIDGRVVSANQIIKNHLEHLPTKEPIEVLTSLEEAIQSKPKVEKISELDNSIESYGQKWRKLKIDRQVVEKKLGVLCGEIDGFLATENEKFRLPFIHKGKGKKARDISKVIWLEEKLADMQTELKQGDKDFGALRKKWRGVCGSYPTPLLSVIANIKLLLDGVLKSTQEINNYRVVLKASLSPLPENTTDWMSTLLEKLGERETHLSPNLALKSHDLRLFTNELFDDERTKREQAVQYMRREQDALAKLSENHHQQLKLHHFNIGFVEGKRKGKRKHQPSNVIQKMLEKQVKAGREKNIDSKSITAHEGHSENVKRCLKALIEEAPAAAQRHFKDDVFSILVMTATNQEPGEFIAAYKKSWHLYPNYHLCYEEVKSSTLSQRKLDELLKLPISSKLCKACLADELTRDQAMILQSIDVHNDLYEMVQTHSLSLDLVFALHGQEGHAWLKALLESPKLHATIEDHRHGPFNQRLWNHVVEKRLKPWQYACMVRLQFNHESDLETILLADDVWKDVNEYAMLYDVDTELRQLKEIYLPKEDEKETTATISLSDVIQTIEPIVGPVTVNQSTVRSKKSKRKDKGRYRL